MKTSVFHIISLCLIIISVSACSNPLDQLASKRLAKEWIPRQYIVNGQDSLPDPEISYTIEFTRDGIYRVNITWDIMQMALEGTWEFHDNRNSIITTVNSFGTSQRDTARILLLTNNELTTLSRTVQGNLEIRYVSIE